MNYGLLTIALLLTQPAWGADDDCFSANGTSLRESYRDGDVVLMGRVSSVAQEDHRTRRFSIEPTHVLKGVFAESVGVSLQDFRQVEDDVPEPPVGVEFLFVLRESGKKKADKPPSYMTLGMSRFSSTVWDPLALDATCTGWRELLGQWTTELNAALDRLPHYKNVWIALLSERTGISEDVLSLRLVDVDVEIRQWRNGFYFRSQYAVLVDWLESPRVRDQFSILVYRPQDSLRANEWAAIDEIRNMMPLRIQSRIPTKIAFRSEEELYDLVLAVTGRSDLVLTYELRKTLQASSVFTNDVASNVCRILNVDIESGNADLGKIACSRQTP